VDRDPPRAQRRDGEAAAEVRVSAPRLTEAQRKALVALAAAPDGWWPIVGSSASLNAAACGALARRGLVAARYGANSTGRYRETIDCVRITDAGRAALAALDAAT
jgi:hypothetical protein